MSQHFSQSKAANNLTDDWFEALDESDATAILRQIRFAENGGEPSCPSCRGFRVYVRKDRRFFCKDCRAAFSITSGTIWHGQRMKSKKVLKVAAALVRDKNGEPSIKITRYLGMSPTTAWLMLHKMREAMQSDANGVVLSGICEADGCHVGGWVREHVYRPMRKLTDRRLTKNKKAVCAVRARKGRVLVQINPDEKSFEPFIREHVETGTELHTDSATTWEKLGDTFAVKSINHAKHFWTKTASTNSVESFFRRLRAAEDTYIHISGAYIDLYAWECAFRETYCHASDAEKFIRLLSLCLSHPYSRRFGGYYQRRKEDGKK